jgi:hypothetical protein
MEGWRASVLLTLSYPLSRCPVPPPLSAGACIAWPGALSTTYLLSQTDMLVPFTTPSARLSAVRAVRGDITLRIGDDVQSEALDVITTQGMQFSMPASFVQNATALIPGRVRITRTLSPSGRAYDVLDEMLPVLGTCVRVNLFACVIDTTRRQIGRPPRRNNSLASGVPPFWTRVAGLSGWLLPPQNKMPCA